MLRIIHHLSTVDIIRSDPLFIEFHVRFTAVPLNSLSV